MPITKSPLRYPGGKTFLAESIRQIIYLNNLQDCHYIEPYAGGAGVAFELLLNEHVDCITINDYDPSIYAFWKALFKYPERFLEKIEKTPISIDEWYKQRNIYIKHDLRGLFHLGFATFFLNRCNHSGILDKAGPIGGIEQKGRWKIDARFNKNNLIKKIERIIKYRDRVHITNYDAIELLRIYVNKKSINENVFVFLDPPYFDKGPALYLNAYKKEDHKALAEYMATVDNYYWIITYDNVYEISKLYSQMNQIEYSLSYTVNSFKKATELVIYNDSIKIYDCGLLSA